MPRRRHHGCEVPGCTRAHEALGLCDTHYVARHCRGAGAPRPVMKRSLAADIDELVVERLAAGDITPGFTTWERRAASARLHQAGRPVLQIARTLRVHPRQVYRDLAAAR